MVLLVVAEGPEQHEQAEATLAGDAAAGGDVLARLLLDVELDPLAAVGVDGAGDELVLGQVAQAEALARLEDDARRAHELRHDDALGAVDHERALVGHHGEVAHEDRLLLDLAGGGVHEPGPHEDRRGEGHVLLLALLDRELRRRPQVLVVGVELQLELQGLGEVLDRADVAEGLREALRCRNHSNEARWMAIRSGARGPRRGSRTNSGPGWQGEQTRITPWRQADGGGVAASVPRRAGSPKRVWRERDGRARQNQARRARA